MQQRQQQQPQKKQQQRCRKREAEPKKKKNTHEANPVILRDDPVDELHLAEDRTFPALSRSQQQQLYLLLLRLVVLSKHDKVFGSGRRCRGIGEVDLSRLRGSHFSFRDGSGSIDAAQLATEIKPTRSATADWSYGLIFRLRGEYVVGSIPG